MSQFSYKYYRHNYTKNENNGKDYYLFYGDIWAYLKIWGLYKWLTLFALFVIAMLLLALLFSKQSGIHVAQPSYNSPITTHTTNKKEEDTQTQKTANDNTLPTMPRVSENKNEPQKKNDVSVYHYPKKVLPSSLLPTKTTTLDNHLVYGPVSIEEYLYFVRESGVPYPHFIDSKTNDLVVENAPECYKLDCPIYDVEGLNKKFYALWLTQESGKKLEVVPDRKDIVLSESNSTL